MAVTRLQRKERRNKTRARVRVENIKLHKSRIFIKSPYADESGIILENMNETVAETAVAAVAPVVEVAAEMPTQEAEDQHTQEEE